MATESWMPRNLIDLLGWTLLHFVWQGAVVGLLAVMVHTMLRKCSANARYLAGIAMLCVLCSIPLLTMYLIERATSDVLLSRIFPTKSWVEVDQPTVDEPESKTPAVPIKVEHIDIDFETPPPADAVPLIPISESGQSLFDELSQRPPSAWFASMLEPMIPWIVRTWFFGVVLLSLRFFVGWWRVQRLRRRAIQPASDIWQTTLRRLTERLRVTHPVQLVESALVEVPTVIGWLRPVILLPATAITGLTTEQLEALLAHELAHVRRHDYLINLLQTIVETLLFFIRQFGGSRTASESNAHTAATISR
ncbi:MAG: M56 family metallopeptidase [Planctomycetia bacterium]|nr:M56 family metallopeptidase [Planctomycetia bacterium]